MKAFEIKILVIDHEQCGAEEARVQLENMRHLNATVMSITERDIGEWHDDHPLNKCGTMARAYHDIFGTAPDETP